MTTESNMYNVAERLKTYKCFKSSYVKPEVLAKEGFYYKEGEDNVECAFCKLGLGDFEEDDDIVELHREFSPKCPFILNRNRTNGPLNEEDICGYQKKVPVLDSNDCMHRSYKNLQTRVDSFKDWPLIMPQRPELLASAGFFYKGVGDQCICFYCGLGLKDWEKDDEPYQEHAKYSPECAYLIMKKGEEFVNRYRKDDDKLPVNNATGLEEKKDDTKEDRLCKVCYQQEANIVLLPCGHVFCVDCSIQLENCAVCRKDIERRQKIYF